MELWRALLRPHRDVPAVQALSFHRRKHRGPRDLESHLSQIDERPRGRSLASCKCPHSLCHQTALNLLFLKFVNIEYKFRCLRAVIPIMKRPHPLFWE